MFLLDLEALHMDPWARDWDQGRGQKGQAQQGNLHWQVVPMTQLVWEETLQQETQGKSQLEWGMLLDLLVHTSRCLQGKARLDKAQGEHRVQREMVRMGTEQDLQVAVLHMDTVLALLARRGTDPGPLAQVDTVPASQGQQGTHQLQEGDLGTALVELPGPRGMGTGPALLDQRIHHRSQPVPRAALELQGQKQAIPGLKLEGGYWREQKGWYCPSS